MPLISTSDPSDYNMDDSDYESYSAIAGVQGGGGGRCARKARGRGAERVCLQRGEAGGEGAGGQSAVVCEAVRVHRVEGCWGGVEVRGWEVVRQGGEVGPCRVTARIFPGT